MAIHSSAYGDLTWRVSRMCDGGACIMVASRGDSVFFGNASQSNHPIYACTKAEWRAFLSGAKLGDFDDVA
jgi:predicted secreted Zn-dependent protease